MAWGLIVLGAICNNLALVMLKLAGPGIRWTDGQLIFTLPGLACLVGSIAAYGLAFLLTLKIFAIFQFSVAVPVFIGFQFVLTALMGYWVFHESINGVTWLGMAVILLGVVLVAVGRSAASA
ncbi:hypothetical protein BFW38_16245 [Terasakiispira papahanaumokuakeensis]|uniref:EamA domain-containing protein n=1 Tax=Terasakiispira papahanaumokuakeensis TaxID=197479 RepID=A0A1E2VCZ9_9GAMM|nr:hypothetical protein [Terasakiispira papahanaumokuakeensis]ODC04851.1 hypothetical protein BFW38_16245 [Terasakiispira papahanaumokuakeensis]